MARRPRPRSEQLITRHLLFRAWALMGSISAALALAIFFAVLVSGGWRPGAAVGPGDALHSVYLAATTATFAAIVACQVRPALAPRKYRPSLRARGVGIGDTVALCLENHPWFFCMAWGFQRAGPVCCLGSYGFVLWRVSRRLP